MPDPATQNPPDADGATLPIDQFKSSLAVVIGIDAYGGGIPPLTTAVNDATRLEELLRTAHGYETLLLTEPATGQPVTRERLRTLFTEELPARLGNDDRLLVYFAGHGVALDGDDGPRGYLAPQDARLGQQETFLAMTDLHAWLTAMPCRHMLAILDCCFAGAFRWSATRELGVLPEVLHQERYDRYIRDAAWQVLTSAAYDQKALDVLAGDVKRGARPVAGEAHSPFAAALFEALAGAGDLIPKGQGDGVITASELYLYLRDTVEVLAEAQAGHPQTPGLWPLKKHDKGEFIFLVPGHALNLPPAPALTAENNPYLGLQSYDEKHRSLFFGRQEEIEELAALVTEHPFVAVLGASGTGKSSLVKAGVAPYLRDKARSNDFSRGSQVVTGTTEVVTTNREAWTILPPMRPGATPVLALSGLLAEQLPDLAAQATPERLRSDADALADLVGVWRQVHPGQKLLLVVDQLEEMITLCRDDTERNHFFALLTGAVQQRPDAFRLVITLRTDFEPQFTETSLFTDHRSRLARYVVPPMDQADLRQVIEGPASERVLHFDPPELVDRLINEVIQTPGALPLLSFTLSELYLRYLKRQELAQRRGQVVERALTQGDYEHLGGVIGSLRNRANEEYIALPDDAHRATLQRVMLRMVAVEGGELARRRVALAELVYPSDAENARVQTVLDRLVSARLLVRGSTDVDEDGVPDPYVEPAHDALVAAWDRLLQWKRAAEDYLPLQRRATQAALEWQAAPVDRQSSLLWDDNPRLPQMEETLWPARSKQNGMAGRVRWARQVLWPKTALPADPRWLNRVEVAFVQASVTRRASGLRRLIAITTAVIVALASLAIFATGQANEATRQRNDANVQRDNAVQAQNTAVSESNARATEVVVRATAQANADRSAKAEATAAADARQKQAQAEWEARRAKAGELAASTQVELSQPIPDPSVALLLARQAILTTWRADGYVVPSADSALQVAVERAGRSAWRMTLPRHRHAGPVNEAAFSPDGKLLVTASDDQTVRIWDAMSGQEVRQLTGHTAGVWSAAYSPDDKLIVTGSDDQTARIWDAATGREMNQFTGHTAGVRSAAFSPDGKQIVTASTDQTVRIWDVVSGQEVRQLIGHSEGVNSAAYSPDGKQIVTASVDQTARIWDAISGQEVRMLTGHTDRVNSAAFSPDGKHIVTASDDETARIWDATSRQELSILTGHGGRVNSAAYSADGKSIVTASDDNTVRIWDATSGQEVRMLSSQGCDDFDNCGVNSAAYSPDAKQIVTANVDQTAHIWDATSGQEVRQLSGHIAGVNSAAYRPDGKYLVTASGDLTARIWDAVSGQEVRQIIGHTAPVLSAAFSPDGQTIVTASADQTARIWDANSGQEVHQLIGHTGWVLSAAYSPDGKTIVTASQDQTARIWDAASGKEMRQIIGHTAGVNSAAYSPDGQTIVTASDDQTACIWDAASGQEMRRIIGHTAGINSAAYSPDGQYLVTASDDQTARIWSATSGQEVRQLTGHGCDVFGNCGVLLAAYSPDGLHLVTAGSDQTARIWDTSTGQEVRLLIGHTGYVWSAVYSPDGQHLVTASNDQTARIWDVSTGQAVSQLAGHTDWVWSAAYSPDGLHLVTASADHTARIWDASSGQEVRQLTGHATWVRSVAYSPDGKHLVTAGDDQTARIWDASSGQEVHQLTVHTGGVFSAAYSPDGKHIVTAGGDAIARIWDAASGQELRQLTGHIGWVLSAAYSPDGKNVVTAGEDGTARIWDATSGLEVRQLRGHTDRVNSAAYSPDGKNVVTASNDLTARIWDATNGQEVRKLTGHTDTVWSAAYSPECEGPPEAPADRCGKHIVTASADGTARIWNAASGQVVRQLTGHTGRVVSAAYSPDGKQVVTASDDQTARIWLASVDDLVAEADRLIQRDPPLLTPDERRRYGLE